MVKKGGEIEAERGKRTPAEVLSYFELPFQCLNQPRSHGSLLPAPWSERGRVGENPGDEVVFKQKFPIVGKPFMTSLKTSFLAASPLALAEYSY